MAIVKTQKIGNAIVHTDDSAYAHLTPEELEKRKAEVRENVLRVARRVLERQEEERIKASGEN